MKQIKANASKKFPRFHLLSKVEWNIFVLDHVHNLALHCENKQGNPIAEKYGPENRDIKHRNESHQEGNTESLCDGIPGIESGLNPIVKHRKILSFC